LKKFDQNFNIKPRICAVFSFFDKVLVKLIEKLVGVWGQSPQGFIAIGNY